MLLPARWLCQAIFVVISGRARPHAEKMWLVCPRPATAVQSSLDRAVPARPRRQLSGQPPSSLAGGGSPPAEPDAIHRETASEPRPPPTSSAAPVCRPTHAALRGCEMGFERGLSISLVHAAAGRVSMPTPVGTGTPSSSAEAVREPPPLPHARSGGSPSLAPPRGTSGARVVLAEHTSRVRRGRPPETHQPVRADRRRIVSGTSTCCVILRGSGGDLKFIHFNGLMG